MNRGKRIVEKAIIMAAGEGKRLRPLTYHTPKPMISVSGVKMIESVIDALHANGINEIYIVTGYLKNSYEELKEKYKDIVLIENPYYADTNNISSLYVAREHLGNCFIIDGDQLIYNPNILDPHYELSGYNVVWCDGTTDEWLLETEDGVVKGCSRTGGEKGWQLFSISRWSEEDGERLKGHLETEFEKNKAIDLYWDDVALFCHPEEYRLGIYEMKYDDLTEIDTIEELVKIDPEYEKMITGMRGKM